MIAPFDGWTLAHGLLGFLAGKIKIRRLWLYPAPFIWEVYQLYFHYQPQNESLKSVWANSVGDIAIFLVLYEIARWYNLKDYKIIPFPKLDGEIITITVYVLFTTGITWLFWDDIFRLRLAAGMPSPQVPLFLGTLSPFVASFIVGTRFNCGRTTCIELPWIRRGIRFNYSAFSMLPSVIIFLIMLCIMIFWQVIDF